MSLFPLDRLLGRLVTHGRLTVIDTGGKAQAFGPAAARPAVTVRITDPGLVRRMIRHPTLTPGEAYMDGGFLIEEGTLRDLLEIMLVSTRGREPSGLLARLGTLSAALRRNTLPRAARNVRHHYDIDHRLYELFLDRDLQYSCAYWREGVTSLDAAQLDKKRHIARKLLLEPGMKVLDIGCGWGGLALHLARDHGAIVTGITLSVDQHRTATRRAAEAGLEDRVSFKLQDYRAETGRYDRVVSVGMFEHVGLRHFDEYFAHVERLLAPDGVALIHTIGRMGPPAPINPWMEKYIFPGAYLPSLSQLLPSIESRSLWLTDVEVLRLHYAKTLAAWDERFQARRAEVAAMFDERFCRMWEFYLQLCELSFRHRTLLVFQLQLARDIARVPITRDYLYAPEGAAVAADAPVLALGQRRRAAADPAGAKGSDAAA